MTHTHTKGFFRSHPTNDTQPCSREEEQQIRRHFWHTSHYPIPLPTAHGSDVTLSRHWKCAVKQTTCCCERPVIGEAGGGSESTTDLIIKSARHNDWRINQDAHPTLGVSFFFSLSLSATNFYLSESCWLHQQTNFSRGELTTQTRAQQDDGTQGQTMRKDGSSRESTWYLTPSQPWRLYRSQKSLNLR